MDGARGAFLSIVADFRLRGAKVGCGCRVMSRGVWGRCSQKHSDGALLREEKAPPDCLITKTARNGPGKGRSNYPPYPMGVPEGSKSQDRLDRISVASLRIVQAAQDARTECGFDTARVAAIHQFHLISPGQGFTHFLPGKGILFLCLDGLQRATLPELNIITVVKLQGFEDLQAAHAEGRREIRCATPAVCPQCPGVQPGCFCGPLALLQQDHLAAILGELAGGRGTRDPATDDEDVGLLHRLLLCRYRTQRIILHRQPVRKRLQQNTTKLFPALFRCLHWSVFRV